VRPPVPYFGSKASIAARIATALPAHQHYVEPYAGGLSVLLAKQPAPLETVNDLDHELVTFWRVVRDQPEQLQRAIDLTPHSRAEHTAAYQPAGDDLETARRVWVRLTQGRSGRLDQTGWRYCIADIGTNMPQYLDGYRRRLPPAAERLMGVQLECRPALDVIAAYGTRTDTLLYVDPPYLGSTRTRGYRHEMRGDDDHRALAEVLAVCQAAVVLSGYHSPLYDDLYADWHRTELATGTANGRTSRARTEVLWSNRPLAAAIAA
jgi:DNA adenine methylase